MKRLGAWVILSGTGPLQPSAFQSPITDSSSSLPDRADFIPDIFRGGEVKEVALAHGPGDIADDLPIGFRCANSVDGLPHSLNASLRIHESSILLERGSHRQENAAKFTSGFV